MNSHRHKASGSQNRKRKQRWEAENLKSANSLKTFLCSNSSELPPPVPAETNTLEPPKAQNDESVSEVIDSNVTDQENNIDHVDQSLETNVIDDTFSEAFDSDVIDKENNRDYDELHLSDH